MSETQTPLTDEQERSASSMATYPNRVVKASFARVLEAKLAAANARIAELEKDAARLRAGLEWYASGEHCILDGPFDRRWEIEEGWLCPPTDDSWMVEPGRVARAILDGEMMNPDKEADEITVPCDAAMRAKEKP